MNHSINTIADYVCDYCRITRDQLSSGDRHWKYMRACYMVIMLSGLGRDHNIANVIGRDRSTVCQNRKTFVQSFRYDKKFKDELKYLKQGLLKYEIS